MQNQKGFTLIELIVVIAIIVILATIILININGYINKGKDAAAKEDMSTLLTDATSFYATKGTFDGVTLDSDYGKAWTGLTASTGSLAYVTTSSPAQAMISCDINATCASGGSSPNSKWCACIIEKAITTNYFCVDSSGKRSEQSTDACAAECVSGACVL